MKRESSDEKTTVLRIEDLEAGYGPTKILRGVSIELRPKEMVTVIGPNGSGKSTVIKSIFGLADVYSGKVALRGEDVTGSRADQMVRKGVGYVPQTSNVFPSLSVRENLEMGAFILSEDVGARLREMREQFPLLDERWGDSAGHLSGGQRQILALARALMVRPSVLLLDEPTAGLAPQVVDATLQLIREINQSGMAVLLVEQNALKALKISDRAYVLARGANFTDDTAESLLSNPEIGQIFLGLNGDRDEEERGKQM